MRRMFGPKREAVAGGWRKLHSEELHKLYNSRDIIWVIKPRGIRCRGHVACMGYEKCMRNFGKPEGKRPL
jgi:hypothetical protein